MQLVVYFEVVIVIYCVVLIKLFYRRRTTDLKLSKEKSLQAHKINNKVKLIVLSFLLIFVLVWFYIQIDGLQGGVSIIFRIMYLIGGITYFFYFIMSFLYSPYTNPVREELRLAVLVPMYNEDPEAFKNCLDSIIDQYRLPDEIHVVNDGSPDDYDEIHEYFDARCNELGIYYTWQKQKNAGKRHAQITGFNEIKDPNNMIIATVDSDGHLDYDAFYEGLRPFSDEEIQSVAGMIVCNNVKEHWLVKIAELIFISQQLTERSFMSIYGSVPVNSGALAFYRYEVVNQAVDFGYLHEDFAHRIVEFSDDSFLTLIALHLGRAVFQYSAKVYTDMPTSIKVHAKQQIRWNKGAFIRGFWRLHYSEVFSAIFFKQMMSWIFFPVLLTIVLYIILFTKLNETQMLHVLLVPAFFGYLSYFRYLEIQRADMSKWEQLKLVLIFTMPSVFWNFFVIKSLKIYAIITVNKRKWGTRSAIKK